MRIFLSVIGTLLLVVAGVTNSYASSTPAQTTPTTIAIELYVLDKSPVNIDAAMLSDLPRRTVSAAAHDQAPSDWNGVNLVDILRKVGAPLDKQLRGRELAKVVRITAADGYQVVFSLAELDAAFSNTVVLLVDAQDGKPLGDDGPFRLIVPNDQRPARWVRNIARIDVIDAAAQTNTSN